jgi:hypothetical protein
MTSLRLPHLSVLLLTLSALAPSAHAARGYDTCTDFIDSLPAVISTPGVWCLQGNLDTAMSAGAAIDVQGNNVVIDCNDFEINGLAAGTASTAYGIRVPERLNTTLRHCTVRGFYIGMLLQGSGHVVEDSRVDASTYTGIEVSGDASAVRRTVVVDTGGSATALGSAIGIKAIGSVDLVDNTISGVAPTANAGGSATAYGISTHALVGTVAGNRVRGLAPLGAGSARGINNQANGRIVVRGNDVTGSGVGVGISCTYAVGAALGNVVSGFGGAGLTGCTAQDNLLVP